MSYDLYKSDEFPCAQMPAICAKAGQPTLAPLRYLDDGHLAKETRPCDHVYNQYASVKRGYQHVLRYEAATFTQFDYLLRMWTDAIATISARWQGSTESSPE